MEGRSPSQTKQIIELVGKPYSLLEGISFGGTGSPALVIKEASAEISELLNRNVDTNYANIELRPKGILLGFQVQHKAWAWVIPFRLLTLFRNGEDLNLHAEGLKVGLEPRFAKESTGAFVRKLQTFMTNYFESVKGPMD